MFLSFFVLIYNHVFENKPKNYKEFFFSLFNFIHLTRQIDRQLPPALIILKLSYFGKINS